MKSGNIELKLRSE